MTPDKLPVDVRKNIWAEAERYAEEKVKAVNEEHFNVYNAHIAGATAWAGWKVKHDELQAQAQCMADALGKISNIVSWMEETGASRISELAETALKQWNSGEDEKKDQLIPTAIYKQQGSKTVTDPCPHCGKELSRDRHGCCRECGAYEFNNNPTK